MKATKHKLTVKVTLWNEEADWSDEVFAMFLFRLGWRNSEN